jgi:hypothetical protein
VRVAQAPLAAIPEVQKSVEVTLDLPGPVTVYSGIRSFLRKQLTCRATGLSEAAEKVR